MEAGRNEWFEEDEDDEDMRATRRSMSDYGEGRMGRYGEGRMGDFGRGRMRDFGEGRMGGGYGEYGERRMGGGYGGYGYGSMGEGRMGRMGGSMRGGTLGGRFESEGPFGSMGTEGTGRGKGPKNYTRSDDRIREDVCDMLEECDIDASDIDVKVRNGEVMLEGTVQQRWEKREAEDIACMARGVKDVHNQLRMNDKSSQTRAGNGRPGQEGRTREGART